jgi:hypothetical protein
MDFSESTASFDLSGSSSTREAAGGGPSNADLFEDYSFKFGFSKSALLTLRLRISSQSSGRKVGACLDFLLSRFSPRPLYTQLIPKNFTSLTLRLLLKSRRRAGLQRRIPKPSPGKMPASSRAGFYGWEADPCCSLVYILHAVRNKSLAGSLVSKR